MVSAVGWAVLAAQESLKIHRFPCIFIVWAMVRGARAAPDSLKIQKYVHAAPCICMVSAVGWAVLAAQESLKIHRFPCIFIVWAMG